MTLLAKDTVKFSVLVALSGIFFDAALAHGLFWENDPYWTYWITKTFLIATVFLLGTAVFGIGVIQGVLLTAVHSVILTVYYHWFAPVGLPQEPEWLDFYHLWITGLPAHFLVIFAGYLTALWLWRRNYPVRETGRAETWPAETWHFAVYGLLAAVLVTIVDGILTQLILLRDFPGITFFVQHLLIAFVFVCAWTAYAGVGMTGWIVGSLMLALLWVTYNMYLGPRGLPLRPPTYSGYEDLWWRAFPGAFVSALIGWWGAGKIMKMRNKLEFAGIVAAILLLGTAFEPAFAQNLPAEKGTGGMKASARASGDGMRIVGPDPVNMQSTQPMNGTITVETVEMGNRWSHIQNTDAMRVLANFTTGGTRYEVTIAKPMPRHPLGEYTTWNGVVYQHEMHGNTGIGTGKLPKLAPEIALWGWAELKRDGQVISRAAPAHVMVMNSGPIPGIMLEIDTEQKALSGEREGYINVMWHKLDALQMPTAQTRTRTLIGWVALIAIVILFGWLAYSEPGRTKTAAA